MLLFSGMVKCAVALFLYIVVLISKVAVLRMEGDSGLFIDSSKNSIASTSHSSFLHQMLSRTSHHMAYAGIKPLAPLAKQLPECPATKETRLATEP